MIDLCSLMKILEEYAPLYLSDKMVAAGGYDNSGIIIRNHENAEKILYTLELSEKAVKRAKSLGADTIITHHPAIYRPVKSLDYTDPVTAPVLSAAALGKNVISMHLNLDIAENGIDMCLCKALGGKDYRIIDYIDDSHGYGREFSVNGITAGDFISLAARVLDTKKIIFYGDRKRKLKKAASFCGAGGQDAHDAVVNNFTDADVIITSDLPHHLIKTFVEKDICLVIIPHSAAEDYGFKIFFEQTSQIFSDRAKACYFSDKRFK